MLGPPAARVVAGAAVLATTLSLLTPAPAGAADPSAPSGVLMIAHRGSVEHAPEHTLAAVDQAVADHADRLSIDVHLSKDGVPVVLHDQDLGRTTDVERKYPGRTAYPVDAFTLAQLKTLDAGSWYGAGTFTGSRLLTLDELLTELADSPTGLTVEVKNPALHGGLAGIGAAVTAVLDAHPEWSGDAAPGFPRLVVESFDWRFLDDLHAARSDLPLVLAGIVTADGLAAHAYVREIDVRFTALTAAVVAAADEAGMFVGTWTPNSTTDLQHAIDVGSDGVTSDQPDRLRSLLREQGRTWTGTTWPAVASTAQVEVSAPATGPVGGRVLVTARPTSASGAALRWQTVSFQSRTAGVWRTVGSNATDSHGAAVLSLPVEEVMRVRVVSAGRVSAERPVAAVTRPVTLPPGAPSPSIRLAGQPRPGTSGADARVTRVSARIWRAMDGRSWRPGCPVGRSGLRTVRVSYWGFDGYRHRGELVVARGSAYRLARVFGRLYAQRLPIRSLHRLETLGTYRTSVGRAVRAGAGFGYACQRVPGDRTSASHARGTVVTVNPWENPAKVAGRGVPNSWWLSRSRVLRYVHRSANPVLRAFAAERFAWNGRYGRYADFRDVR